MVGGTSSVGALLSKIKVDRSHIDLSSTNIARADVEGYTRKYSYDTEILSAGSVGGVMNGATQRSIDTVLQSEVCAQNSRVCFQDKLNNYYQRISTLLGHKGDELTFVHDMGRLSAVLGEVQASPTDAKKREVVMLADKMASRINTLSDQINKYRKQVDADLGQAVTDANALLDKVYALNVQIGQLSSGNTDITGIMDNRDLAVHELYGMLGIKTQPDKNNTIDVTTQSGTLLVTTIKPYHMSYATTAYILPGDVLSPVLAANGTSMNSDLTTGSMGALLELRDVVLTDLQAELDEISRVLRDSVNAAYNQGSSFNGPSTMTGQATAPGVAGTLAGATPISGTGTLRIAVTDNMGTILDYKDVGLSNGMTITSLMASINGAAYTLSNAAGAFNVTQLATGELQITSTAGNSVAIGGVLGVQPMISPGAVYSGAQGYGFSHFFGLNNLFMTPPAVASSTAQVGIANSLAVNPTFVANPHYLSVGSLNDAAVIPTSAGLALEAKKVDVAKNLHNLMANGNVSFLAAGAMASTTTTIKDYASRVFTLAQMNIQSAASDFKEAQGEFEQLSQLAFNFSGVDTSDELLVVMRLSTSQQLTSKALNIVQSMERDLITTLASR